MTDIICYLSTKSLIMALFAYVKPIYFIFKYSDGSERCPTILSKPNKMYSI